MGRTGRGGGKGKMVCAPSRSPKPKLRFGDTKGKIGKDTENLNGLETNTQAVLFSLECCQFGVLDRRCFHQRQMIFTAMKVLHRYLISVRVVKGK